MKVGMAVFSLLFFAAAMGFGWRAIEIAVHPSVRPGEMFVFVVGGNIILMVIMLVIGAVTWPRRRAKAP